MEPVDLVRLENKRVCLRTSINNAIRQDKPISFIKDKVEKYNNILNTLTKSNVKLPDNPDYLKPAFWDTHTPEDVMKTRKSRKNMPKPKKVKELSPEPQNNYYMLNIAGNLESAKDIESQVNTIYELISGYMKAVYNKDCYSKDFDDNPFQPSYLIRVEYECTEREMDIIKKSIHFLLRDYNNKEIYYTNRAKK